MDIKPILNVISMSLCAYVFHITAAYLNKAPVKSIKVCFYTFIKTTTFKTNTRLARVSDMLTYIWFFRCDIFLQKKKVLSIFVFEYIFPTKIKKILTSFVDFNLTCPV